MNDERRGRVKGLLVGVVGMVCVAAHAAAPGWHLSGDYLMTVDGHGVDIISVPTPERHIWNKLERQPYSFAPFVATGTVEVCVESGFIDLSKTEILPRSKGVAAVSQSVDTVVFRMTPPMTLVLEPKGRHRALVVSANLPEANPPPKDDPKVKWFGPGFHRANKISLSDDETLYLAPGAWVEGFVLGRGRNIAICGSGVLSGACWDWHKGPAGSRSFNESGTLVTLSGENIVVRDATFFSSWGWTLVFNAVTNAVVDNVKVIGGRVINDDGIDVCRARDVVLRNSFVRCQDDCITPKYWCENLVCTNMTLWTDAANAFRTGYECEPGESGLVYRNLLFRDIDVLHLSLNKTTARDYWANCAIYIQPAHGQTMYDTVYEDIRFHEVGAKDVFLNVKTMPITQGSKFCRTGEAGMLKGLVLRNIHLPDSHGGMCVNLSAHDDVHPIEGVRFENVTGYGPITKSGKVDIAQGGGWQGFRAPAAEAKAHVLGCLWLEAEQFADYGGWKIDTQYVGQMGSAYLIAPGVTGTVAAASTALHVPESGTWHVWVRTRNWLSEFSPGTFALEIGGQTSLPLGNAAEPGWRWQRAGDFELTAGRTTVRLVDTSGWFARCDAILLTTDAALMPPDDFAACEALRLRCSGAAPIRDGGGFDVIVVGAGPAGSAAAIASARAGAKTLLVTDRPIVGGNASSEFRMTTSGPDAAHPEFKSQGIDGEMRALLARGLDGTAAYGQLMRRETNLTVVVNRRIVGATTHEKTGRVVTVCGLDTLDGSRHCWSAKSFVDATGDGWLGFYAGAKWMFGSESRGAYGERYAPAESNSCTMAGTLMTGLGLESGWWWGFRRERTAAPVRFVALPWILPLPKGFHPSSMIGLDGGMFEHPHALDDVADPEAARDYLVRMVVTYWNWLKNASPHAAEIANDRLTAIPWTEARREGRRLVGDVVITECDLLAGRKFPDSIGQGGYAVTTHNPGGSFVSDPSYPRPQPPLYDIPYRALYSVNVSNLWMCGRCASMTHRALGSMRVQSTCAVTGEAAGRAAAVCALCGWSPREYGRRAFMVK